MSLQLGNRHLAVLGIALLAVIAGRIILADTGTTPLNPGHPLSQTWIDTNLNMGPYLIKVGSATIKGDGTVSTGLNAEKVGGYTAADLMAAGGSSNNCGWYPNACPAGYKNANNPVDGLYEKEFKPRTLITYRARQLGGIIGSGGVDRCVASDSGTSAPWGNPCTAWVSKEQCCQDVILKVFGSSGYYLGAESAGSASFTEIWYEQDPCTYTKVQLKAANIYNCYGGVDKTQKQYYCCPYTAKGGETP